jgi:zinc protease
MKTLTGVLLYASAAAICALSWPAQAQQSARNTGSTPPPQIKYERYKLANGLEVILHEDHKLPIVAVDMWYHVGPVKERPGRTGFAHLYEHMMFEGSKHVGEKGQIPTLERAGATDINGTTAWDRTNYFETMPANQLETALWLESDRMGFLLDTLDRTKLANQRDVVRNERRQSGEAQPYGIVDEEVYHQIFPKAHPYYADVIGSHADIEAARLADVREFFTEYYAPNNATMAIAGDYDPATIKGLIEKYFGPIPHGPEIAAAKVETPAITSERRVVVTDTVQLPKVNLAWLSPAAYKPGDAEANLAANILGTGKSSRMYRELVYRQQIAQSVNCYQDSMALVSKFQCELVAKPNVTAEKLEAESEKIIDEFARTGPTAEEVEWARNKIETQLIGGLERLGGFGGVADVLNQYNQYTGDPGYLPKDLARYDTATPANVQSFAQATLGTNQRVVVFGVPGEKKINDVPRSPDDTDANVKVTPPHTEEFEKAQAWRATPPKPGAERPLTLPRPAVFTLANGMTVYVVERHELPIVSAQLTTIAGRSANPADRPGLAGLTTALLTEGTEKRGADEIATAAAMLGTDLRAESGSESAALSVTVLSRNLTKGLELIADSAEHPSFPEKELDRVRANRLTALLQEEDDPFQLGLRVGQMALYGPGSQYGYDALGTEASLKGLTREQVAKFHAEHYGPRTVLLELTGDVTAEQARKLAGDAFGAWTSKAEPCDPVAAPGAPARKVLIVDKPGLPQTTLMTFGLGLDRRSEDYPAATVMNTMLGGLFSSRINMNLREQHGYTYGATSLYWYHRGQGAFLAYAQVRQDVTAPALEQLFKELDGIHTTPLTEDELRRSKDSIIRSLPGNFESAFAVNGQLQEIWLYGLPLDYYSKLPAKVEAVSSADAQKAAEEYVHPENLLVIAVGDKSKIEQGLKDLKLGPVSTWTAGESSQK